MKIDVTDVDMVKLAKTAYDLSRPKGMGYFHFKEEPLSDNEAQELVDCWKRDDRIVLDMDYVSGRAVKLTVFKEGKKRFFLAPWYDHSDMQLEALCKSVGINAPKPSEHGVACNCGTC